MAISETLIQLVDIRDDIRQAIADKGIDMTGTIPLSEYPGKIAGIGDFPGYQVKTGELCSLPAKSGTANGGLTQTLDIPAGCIPLCVKIEPEMKINSGKGESPSYVFEVWDNNNKMMYRVVRNGGSGWMSAGTDSTQYINPLGAYDGDVAQASTITAIKIKASNGSGSLISDYRFGKISVTMWLEPLG
ncbi:hypothetical protein [Holdemania massiliensis]|uniref:Uncharacterized protein n=1 Tax=Holdemania massiliensis TaxID=1468449 RepID=A0A6N7S5W2_9FIRM|nr:hypothetical protein [Holdemania massiliensis]MSA70955.1 hypothetical protein [Holdemania massiliensis]MSA89281.1 hypothetical protein [Holdemania massiliensis]MSB78034.1 hypothetical protein [Holdemania massiliensis]MSC32959.1 hypothetical protein [Holdemania massiliensis]MSC39356.1 hypothetical protein [Holdemania massiliensis]